MIEDPKSATQSKQAIGASQNNKMATTPLKMQSSPLNKGKKAKAIAPIAGQSSLDFFIKREGKKQVSTNQSASKTTKPAVASKIVEKESPKKRGKSSTKPAQTANPEERQLQSARSS